MMTTTDHPRFRTFVENLRILIEDSPDEETVLRKGGILLQALVQVDDWLPEIYAKPDSEHYQQYLLHSDEADRFSIVSFVWGPGQKTPIHNHTVWGMIGILRGAEYSQGYRQNPNGTLVPEGEAVLLKQGEVDAVSPQIGDLHAVSNAFEDKTSISIHVYGANIGKIQRAVFQIDGTSRLFTSGYSNA
jgi:predicted metal-dependent enzyme (double-stranded beta helix superfamily)